jgi:putative chitinase
MAFDEKIYFDTVRIEPFGGKLTQEQVNGQKFILASWTRDPTTTDLRWLAYALATTMHETASTMLPIEEYGKGKGKPYGQIDPVTGQAYFGRGFVQLTWRDNYRKATRELGLTGENDLELHAERALDPEIAADIMFKGMAEGWFRGDKQGRQTLLRYFDDDTNDPYTAREIINGDKHLVPSWSDGMSIGKLIAGYHSAFLNAVTAAYVADTVVVEPEPEPFPPPVVIDIALPDGIDVVVKVNGKTLIW